MFSNYEIYFIIIYYLINILIMENMDKLDMLEEAIKDELQNDLSAKEIDELIKEVSYLCDLINKNDKI